MAVCELFSTRKSDNVETHTHTDTSEHTQEAQEASVNNLLVTEPIFSFLYSALFNMIVRPRTLNALLEFVLVPLLLLLVVVVVVCYDLSFSFPTPSQTICCDCFGNS